MRGPEQALGGRVDQLDLAFLADYDEPIGNLDSAHGHEVMGLLAKLNQAGTTIVMVTHDQGHAEYGSRVIQLLDGSVVSASPTAVAV